MNPFFKGLEDRSAFSFYFDDSGKAIPVKETDYIIYEGDIFPMVIFGDELRALNDYCYKIVTVAEEEQANIKERLDYYIKEERNPSAEYTEFTPYEMQISLKEQQNQWNWIADVTAGYLVIFKADDRGVLGVRRLRITQKITEITRFGAYRPLYTDAIIRKLLKYISGCIIFLEWMKRHSGKNTGKYLTFWINAER